SILQSSSSSIIENIITDGTELFNTSTNTTAKIIVKATPLLKLIHDYLLVILLISVMFSMGCGVTIFEVWNHLRRPTAVLVCIAAQFFLVPFIGYLIITLLELEVLHSTGLLILACCPGGVTSNIFTFLADGDLPLSITMTSVATIAALLLMPLNVWLYGRNLETNNLVIPYMEMSITLILVTIPVIIGMIINWRLPKYTPYITKIGVFAGFGIICFCQSLEVIIFPDIFFGVPYRLYTAVILLPAFSFMAGYIFAKIFRLDNKICRTIGIEIGIKNVGSALTIISLSFTLQQLKKAWVFPFLYAFSSFLVIFAVTIGYKMIKRLAFNQLHKDFQQVNQTTNEKFKKNINNDENDNRIINVNDDDEMNIIKERLLLVNEQNVKQFQIINQR
uniref:Solute carrier family 10 member 6-like n=1 Tax=Dermatophagoides pteronyssinus TaxID=6956 RepID=A0A6P6Y7Y8_DERPT